MKKMNQAPNVKYFYIVIVIIFYYVQVLQFGAHKGALTKKRSFLVTCTTFRSDFHSGWKNQNKHSTLNSSFDALSKWHEPHRNQNVIVGCRALFHAIENWRRSIAPKRKEKSFKNRIRINVSDYGQICYFVKVQLFWEGYKNVRNRRYGFDVY